MDNVPYTLSNTLIHSHKVLLKCILRAARSGGECKLNYNIDAAAAAGTQANVREWYNMSITQVITIIVEIKADQRQKGSRNRYSSQSNGCSNSTWSDFN